MYIPLMTTPASSPNTTTTLPSQPNPTHQVDNSLQYLIILHIESTHDGAHPGDPTSGKIDDLILPVADPMHHHTNSSPTLIPSTCPAPPSIPSVPIDQADILSIAYCIYHLATDKVVHRHLHLCTPQSMPLTPYCEARSGVSITGLKPTLPSLTDFFQTLQTSLMQFGFDLSESSSKFAFLSYNAFNLRLLLPSECRRKRVDIPAFLNQPTYLLLTQEVQKWMCHHPDSAHDLASFALRDLCYYFRATLMQGVPISRLPYARQCLRFTANFDIPINLQLLDHTPSCHNFTPPSGSPITTTDSALSQQPDHHLLLPSPLHRCESIANLVRALREYAYSDVLTTPINAKAGMFQFEVEKSTFINLSGLPRSPSVPTYQDLLAWFHNQNLYPIKLLMLVTRARAPTGDGFVEFASHHEAKSALLMNGQVFRSRHQDAGNNSTTSTLGLIEVAASSPIVLHHAKDFLVPFPSRVVDNGQSGNSGLSDGTLCSSWTCVHCAFHNFSSKRTCLKCNYYTSPHVSYNNQLNSAHAYGTSPSGQYNGNKPIVYRSTGAPPGLSFSDPVALAMGEGVMSSNNHSNSYKRPQSSNGNSGSGHFTCQAGMSARSQWPCEMCGTQNYQHGALSSCSYCGVSRSKSYYDNQMTNPAAARLSQSPSNESYHFGQNDPSTNKFKTYTQGRQDASHPPRRVPNVHDTSRCTGAPLRPTVNPNRNTPRYLNHNTQSGHHHGPKPVRPGDWICPVLECQFQNFASRAVCLKCGVASPTPPQAMCPVPFRMGDWLCFACTAHNFASRINCVRCGCTKVYSLSTKNATSLEMPGTSTVVQSSYKSDSAVDIFKIPPLLNTPATYSKSVGSTRPRRHTLSSNPPSLSLV